MIIFQPAFFICEITRLLSPECAHIRSHSDGFSLFSTLYWSVCTSWSTQNCTWLSWAVTLRWVILPLNLAFMYFSSHQSEFWGCKTLPFVMQALGIYTLKEGRCHAKNPNYSETPQTTRESKQTNGKAHKEHNKSFARMQQMMPASTNRQLHTESHFGNLSWSCVLDEIRWGRSIGN